MNLQSVEDGEFATQDVVLTLNGDVTVDQSATLHADLIRALHGRGSVTVDMTCVSYLHTSALQLFVSAEHVLRNLDRKFILLGVSESIARAIRLAGFDALFLSEHRTDTPPTDFQVCVQRIEGLDS